MKHSKSCLPVLQPEENVIKERYDDSIPFNLYLEDNDEDDRRDDVQINDDMIEESRNDLQTTNDMIEESRDDLQTSDDMIEESRDDSISSQLYDQFRIMSSNDNLGLPQPLPYNSMSSLSNSSITSEYPSLSKTCNQGNMHSPEFTKPCQMLPPISLLPPNTMNLKEKGIKGIIKNLHKCAKAGKPRDAEALLVTMQKLYSEGHTDLKPDVRHYNSILNAWAKSKEEGKELRAQQILDWMYQLNDIADGNYNIKPSLISFNICINAWCKSKEKNAGDRILYLFNRMLSLHQAGDSDLKPDYKSYKTVIVALSRKVERGSASKAEGILQKMRQSADPHTNPDSSLYNIVIHMYSKNRDVNAPLKAEALLNEMHFAFMNGNMTVQPNTITFNTVLNTYAKSITQGSAARAEVILQRMQELYDNGYPNVEPDTISFNSVINAHANSRAEESAAKAFDILNKMQELHQTGRIQNAKPNTRTYNACLKACYCSSYVASKEISAQNFDIACALLSQTHGQLHSQADEQTYIWFFRACQANSHEEARRDHVFEWALHMCCKDRLWTERVLEEVCQTIGQEIFQRILKSSGVSLHVQH